MQILLDSGSTGETRSATVDQESEISFHNENGFKIFETGICKEILSEEPAEDYYAGPKGLTE